MLPFEYGGQQTLNPTSISGLSKKFLEACNNGNLSEVRECLEEGVDVNVQDEDGVSAAMIVMKNKNIHVLKLLSEVDSLDWNLEDVEGNTVASWYSLIYSGTVFDEAFNELKNIESIDWNHQNKEGCTVSLRAAYYTNVECLKMLSQKKNIDWNLQDEDGNTPLLAVAGGCEKSLKRLKNLLRGANEIKENHRRQTNKTEINIIPDS